MPTHAITKELLADRVETLRNAISHMGTYAADMKFSTLQKVGKAPGKRR